MDVLEIFPDLREFMHFLVGFSRCFKLHMGLGVTHRAKEVGGRWPGRI